MIQKLKMLHATIPSEKSKIPVVAVVGPTGAGKSALATYLAGQLGGEIVNCDSLQVYRGFDVGTAKPSHEERQRVAHHLIDIADPAQEFTAGEFARQAREVIHTLSDRKKLPVVAGGTGFYLKAMVDGLVEGPRGDAGIRERLGELERRRPGALHRALRLWDRPTAERIHPADVQKLTRAAEVILLRNQPLSQIYKEPRDAAPELEVFQIGIDPPRQALYERLEQRAAAMLRDGLIDEVRELLRRGVPESAKPFGAIGYKQALLVLHGEMDERSALQEMQRDTRRYAKRQWTWFRRDPRVRWVSGFGDSTDTHQKVVGLLYKRFFWY